MTLRSLNPALASIISTVSPRISYGFGHLVKPKYCQQIIDRLDLKSKYPDSSKLDIVDIFTGHGLFSSMVNYELEPRNHVVVDGSKEVAAAWERRLEFINASTNNKENFRLYPHNAYDWKTYDDMINRDNVVSPSYKPRDRVHDELLIIANSTSSKFGESLFAQWLMCALYSNWLQKYGKVRMLCFVPAATAMKFTLQPGFNKRHKAAVKTDLYTDTKLIAITRPADLTKCDGEGYDPRRILRDDPILIPSLATQPLGKPLALLELLPREVDTQNVDYFEYVIKTLCYNNAQTVQDNIRCLGPGASDDLVPLIPIDILDKPAVNLSHQEWKLIFDIFLKWPFKPAPEDLVEMTQDDHREI